jgi:phage terminase large subunit-like protein
MRRSSVEMTEVRTGNGEPTVGEIIQFIEDECILPDRREPMEVHPYQADLIEQWHDPSTKVDATVIGAGNAKTTTFGAYLTAHLFLTFEADVPVVAETITQAWLTTAGKIKRFVELNPSLAIRAEILEGQGSRRGVYVPGMGGHMYPIASKPAGLQGLNPSIAALEEMSEASMATFGALMNRLGKRAGLNKLVGVSTPSFEPNNALISLQQKRDGGESMEGVNLIEYVSDQKDHRDESEWYKANPALAAGVLDMGAIRTDLAALPEQQFRCYRLAQNPVGGESCWINSLDEQGDEVGDAYEVWQRGASAWRLREDAPTWVGVDVAKSRDHAACVWGQFRDDGRLHVRSKVWTPTSEADIDLDEIGEHLKWLAQMYDLQSIWYDPSYFYNAVQLDKDGLPMVAVIPTEQIMAPLVGHAYQAVRRTRITHQDEEQLNLHVLAAKRRYCARGFTLEKRDFQNKIDAAVALVLCHAAAVGLDDAPNYTLDSFKVW